MAPILDPVFVLPLALTLGLPGLASAAPRLDLTRADLPVRGPRHPRIDDSIHALALDRSRADEVLLLEIRPAPGVALAAIRDPLITAHGGRVVTRGRTVLDARVPRGRILALADAAGIGWIGPPRRPRPHLGPTQSEGVAATLAAGLHAKGIDGADVDVGVIDFYYQGLQTAIEAGEIAAIVGDVDALDIPGSTHGTRVAEVVSDMAPGVRLHPRAIASYAEFEAVLAEFAGVVDLLTMSFGWGSDFSFFDGTGPLCAHASELRADGTVWIASAGNDSTFGYQVGKVHQSTFIDSDDDGIHEFAPGVEIQVIKPQYDAIEVELSWDAFPATAEDYDVHIHELDGDLWIPLESGADVQDGTQLPYEYALHYPVEAGKTYGVSIERIAANQDDLRLRLYASHGWLQHFQNAATISEPGHCVDVTAVGALAMPYETEANLPYYSSVGPTNDGRFKPDLVAPTAVLTSTQVFTGTSAAAPHVAGALALTMQATGTDSVEALELLLAGAVPMGTVPGADPVFGRGRLHFDAALGECEPGQLAPCATACASLGEQACALGLWGACQPPAEACNGVDDDCDDEIDEDAVCGGETTTGETTTGETTGDDTGDSGDDTTAGIDASSSSAGETSSATAVDPDTSGATTDAASSDGSTTGATTDSDGAGETTGPAPDPGSTGATTGPGPASADDTASPTSSASTGDGETTGEAAGETLDAGCACRADAPRRGDGLLLALLGLHAPRRRRARTGTTAS